MDLKTGNRKVYHSLLYIQKVPLSLILMLSTYKQCREEMNPRDKEKENQTHNNASQAHSTLP